MVRWGVDCDQPNLLRVLRVSTRPSSAPFASLGSPTPPLRFDVVEALTGFTRNKRYKLRVWDPARGAEVPKEGVTSGDVMKIKEDSDCCCRIFLGPARAFRMSLYPYAEVREGVVGGEVRVNKDASPITAPALPLQGQYPPPGADIFTLPGSVTLERPFRCGGGEGAHTIEKWGGCCEDSGFSRPRSRLLPCPPPRPPLVSIHQLPSAHDVPTPLCTGARSCACSARSCTCAT